MKTPKILEPALRQYRHNNSDDFVTAFDYKETINIIEQLERDLVNSQIDVEARERFKNIIGD